MNLFDASAVLSFLLGEPGSDVVERELLANPSAMSSANWSEVAQKTLRHSRDWRAARALLLGFGVSVESVTVVDAEAAARLWTAVPHLSLGDRLCLATGERLDATIWTSDQAWGTSGRIRQIR